MCGKHISIFKNNHLNFFKTAPTSPETGTETETEKAKTETEKSTSDDEGDNEQKVLSDFFEKFDS